MRAVGIVLRRDRPARHQPCVGSAVRQTSRWRRPVNAWRALFDSTWLKRVVATVGLVALLIPSPAAAQGTPRGWSQDELVAVERCVASMLMGPWYEGIDVRGEGFDCHETNGFTPSDNGGHWIVGHLSHRLTWRPDDDIFVTVETNAAGALTDIKTSAVDGGFSVFVPPFLDVSEGALFTQTRWQELSGARLVRAVATNHPDRNWKTSANVILTVFAIEAARSQARPDFAPAFFHYRYGAAVGSAALMNRRRYAGVEVDDRFRYTYWRACAAICEQNNRCHAWSLHRPEPSRRQYLCRSYGEGSAVRASRNAVSGLLVRGPQAPRATDREPTGRVCCQLPSAIVLRHKWLDSDECRRRGRIVASASCVRLSQ